MDIQAVIQEKAALTDNALRKYLEHPQGPQEKIYEAMEYSLFAGGKRLRPVIMLLACELCGGSAEDVLPFACALEMIHTYSLIHDDLPAMDNDDLRRGKPTSHKVFGEGMAILAGDALLNKAFEIVCRFQNLSPAVSLEALRILSGAAGTEGMIGGQVIDIENTGKEIDIETLACLHLLKTGALIRAAGKIGAVAAGGSAAEVKAIDEYCKNLGLAFQIRDDVLDVTGNSSELGKATGNDQENGKTTYVTIYGVDQAEKLVEYYTKKAVEALAGFGGRGEALTALAAYLLGRRA